MHKARIASPLQRASQSNTRSLSLYSSRGECVRELRKSGDDYRNRELKSLQTLQSVYQSQYDSELTANDMTLSEIRGTQVFPPHRGDKDYKKLYKELKEQFEVLLCNIYDEKEKLLNNGALLMKYENFADQVIELLKPEGDLQCEGPEAQQLGPLTDLLRCIVEEKRELQEKVALQNGVITDNNLEFEEYTKQIQELKEEEYLRNQQDFANQQQRKRTEALTASSIIIKEDAKLAVQNKDMQAQINDQNVEVNALKAKMRDYQELKDKVEELEVQNSTIMTEMEEMLNESNNKVYIERLIKDLSLKTKEAEDEKEKVKELELQTRQYAEELNAVNEELVLSREHVFEQENAIQRHQREEELFLHELTTCRGDLKIMSEEYDELKNKRDMIIKEAAKKYEEEIKDMQKRFDDRIERDHQRNMSVAKDLLDGQFKLFQKLIKEVNNGTLCEIRDMCVTLEEKQEENLVLIQKMLSWEAGAREGLWLAHK